ncbi:MAG: hypothetical protein IKJ45_00390, partial [Kiritimatiellae bacterium]|nr:hypothetical protein [Kiritimatiellia bacterium]
AALEDDGDVWAAHGKRRTTGIDTFNDTYLHESHHVKQIAQADNVVGIVPATVWRFGWSWNVTNHNHWAVGADCKPGVSSLDDDGNGYVDDMLVIGPGELGHGDDQLLDAGMGEDWPTAFGPMPPLPWAGGCAIEVPAYNCEHDNEGEYGLYDWGNPGKQHKTIGKFDD